jgi:dolichol-phosphate mannosyltransferase
METSLLDKEIKSGLDVSIILPTFNEEGNIARIIKCLCEQMIGIQKKFEILVMDDNSVDGTVSEVNAAFENDERVKVIVREPQKRGLAFAIREGIEKSKGEYILVMDTDFNHDPEVTGKMVSISKYYDIVSGSRFTTGGGMDSSFRWWCSLMFNLWVRVLLALPTQDNLAGFYCIKKEKLEELDYDKIFRNYGDYFFRMLFLARNNQFTILEIPVWYRNRSHGVSKTPFLKTLLLYTSESLKLRINNI